MKGNLKAWRYGDSRGELEGGFLMDGILCDVHLYQTMSVLCIYLGKEIRPNHVSLFRWIDI